MNLFKKFEKGLKQTINEFELKDNFSYVGLIGSSNTERDIDLLILPKNEIKLGEFFKITISFLEILKKNLTKNKIGLVVFTHEDHQKEVEYISKVNKKKEIFLHLITQVGWLRPTKVIKEIMIRAVKKTNKTYLGDINYVQNLKEMKPSIDYQHLFFSNCLYSRYPKQLEEEKINEMANFILKRRNEKKQLPQISNKELYLYICDHLDKQPKIKELEIAD